MSSDQEFRARLRAIACKLEPPYLVKKSKREAFQSVVAACVQSDFKSKLEIAFKTMADEFGVEVVKLSCQEDESNLETVLPYQIKFPAEGVTAKLDVVFWSRPENPDYYKAKIEIEPHPVNWKLQVGEFPLDGSNQTGAVQFLEKAITAASDGLLSGGFG